MNKRTFITALFVLLVRTTFGQPILSDSTYPPPGRLVDIGGRKLHVVASGSGSPAIVFVAGGSAYAIDWYLVQSKIDSITRVISYDRAGLGWSDDGPLDETVEQTVTDLHTLLQQSGEKGPFILAGASIGGIFIRAYQRRYPNEVAGLVFSNSSNRVGLATKTKADLLWNLTEDDIRSHYPLPSTIEKGPRPFKESAPFDRLPSNLQAMRLYLDILGWKKWEREKVTADPMLSWRKEFIHEFDETDFDKKLPLGNLPVVVLSSDVMANDSVRHIRNGMGGRLDFLSSNSLHITAAGSGHEMHLFQPGTVILGLKRMVIAIRKKIPLSDVPDQ